MAQEISEFGVAYVDRDAKIFSFFLHFLYSFLTVDFFGYHFRLYSLSAVNFDDKVVVPCMLLLFMVLQLLSFHASCRENQHSKHQIITLKSKIEKKRTILAPINELIT